MRYSLFLLSTLIFSLLFCPYAYSEPTGANRPILEAGSWDAGYGFDSLSTRKALRNHAITISIARAKKSGFC